MYVHMYVCMYYLRMYVHMYVYMCMCVYIVYVFMYVYVCIYMYMFIYIYMYLCIVCVRGEADKSLARPGRKQATVNKLGIYSTYSPRSSIHFLARCSYFCKPLKINS